MRKARYTEEVAQGLRWWVVEWRLDLWWVWCQRQWFLYHASLKVLTVLFFNKEGVSSVKEEGRLESMLRSRGEARPMWMLTCSCWRFWLRFLCGADATSQPNGAGLWLELCYQWGQHKKCASFCLLDHLSYHVIPMPTFGLQRNHSSLGFPAA